MDAKIIIYAVMFVLLIGGGYGIYHSTEIDEANKELLGVTGQVAALETHIKNQQTYLELRKEVSALISAVGIMQTQATTLRKEVAVYREDEFRARKDFEQAIEKSRRDASGLVVVDPVLPSGLRLFNARVQKVEGNVTTVIHSEGISQLTPDMLPKELRERFRFGMPLEAPPPSTVVAAAPLPTEPTPGPAGVAPPAGGDAASQRQSLEGLKTEMRYLEEELKKAEAEAQAATSPTKRFTAKNRVDSVTQQITDLTAKVKAAEEAAK